MLDLMITIAIGLLSSLILFYKFPSIKINRTADSKHQLSIIIPARNEEKNIRLLLQDLMRQNAPIHEIICVDDGSIDKTFEVASSFDVKTISIKDKPGDWMGKTWACQTGADTATGDMLLFLDADVRLSPHAISRLMHAYEENRCVISVQPYHQTDKHYEQFSFFFNLIQIAGNGTSMIGEQECAGLCGPVILIDQQTYLSIDRHLSAKNSIVDDMAMGKKLKQMGFPFKLFMGSKDISYRMYGDNFKSLFQGWTKNYASGALKTSLVVFGLVFLWVTSCIASVIIVVQSLWDFNMRNLLWAMILYLLWVLELFRVSKDVGQFKKSTIFAYPIYLFFFLMVFFISLFKKVFKMDVAWKGRKIKQDRAGIAGKDKL